MNTVFIEDFETIKKIGISAENEKQLRDRLFSLIMRIRTIAPSCKNIDEFQDLRNMNRACLLILRKLQNEVICGRESDEFKPVYGDAALLAQRIVCASNLLIFGANKRLSFECSSERIRGGFDPFLFETALMNSISNACKFSNPGVIKVKVANSNSGINVRVSNSINWRAASKAYQKDKRVKGLETIQKASNIHGGAFMFSPIKQKLLVSAFSIKYSDSKGLKEYEPPELSSFFTDKLSPVYIGMSEVCSCPI